MPSFRELLAATKAEIREVDTAEAEAARAWPARCSSTCASPRSTSRAPSPAPSTSPAATSRAAIESRVPDKATPIVIHCASGVRSAFAAKTLAELGYTDVASMAGGFNKWKDESRDWAAPRSLTAEQRNRYQRHLLLPEVDIAGQQKLLDSRVLLLGAGGPRLARPRSTWPPPASARSASSTWTSSTSRTSSARSSTTWSAIGDRKVDSAKKTLTLLNPDVDVVSYDVRLGADNVMDILPGWDVIVDGTDNFPTRFLVNDASVKLGIPVVHGSIFRFEGMVTVFDPQHGPTYRDMVPEPPPAEMAPELRRGRRARRAPGHHRLDPGHRDDQAAARPRRPADRPAPRLRQPRAVVPRVQGAARPDQRDHLRQPRPHRRRRARRPLHAAPAAPRRLG